MADYSSSVPNRLTVLETRFDHIREDLDELSNKIDNLEDIVNKLDKKLDIIVTQREDADKRLSRWKSGAITLATSLVIALIGFLVKIAYVVQSSKLTSF